MSEELEGLEVDEPAAITINDLLGDAATCLEEKGYRGLAIGVRMAAAELGGNEKAESYVRDMMEALETADAVIHAAHNNPNSVNLSDLNEAIEKVRNWGLDPHERMGNAMLHILRTLHQVMFALEQPDGGLSPTLVQNIKTLLGDLGYDDLLS